MPRPLERKDDQSTTRARIVRLLKRWGEGSVADLAVALSVTESAVRQHIGGLESEGMLQFREAGQGPGRRRRLYSTTGEADRLFPDRYEVLLLALLDEIGRDVADPALSALFIRQKARFLSLLDLSSAESRLEALGALMGRSGFLPEITYGKDGRATMSLDHCPIWSLAKSYHVCCSNELAMFREALPGWIVERISWRNDNQPSCGYTFAPAAS